MALITRCTIRKEELALPGRIHHRQIIDWASTSASLQNSHPANDREFMRSCEPTHFHNTVAQYLSNENLNSGI